MAQGKHTEMFVGLSAWFSNSVRERRTDLWKNEGGEITLFDKAQFVFSDNADAPDTKRLYETEAYLEEHLSIFHSMYIDKCVNLGDTKQVVLGDYFLPPSDIQNLVRKQIHYKWELDKPETEPAGENTPVQENEMQLEQQEGNGSSTNLPSEEQDRGGNHVETERQESHNSEDPIDVEKLVKYKGPLEEFIAGKNGCELFCLQ